MTRRRIAWTSEEDTELRRIYALSSAGLGAAALRALAHAKGIDRWSCYERARTLDLKRVSGSRRRWTNTEIENLETYAGRLPVYRIARILARSRKSVVHRIHLLNLSSRVKQRGYTKPELAELMGVDLQSTLNSMLKRWPMRPNLLGHFSEDDVQLWVWDHLEELEYRKFNRPWFLAILRRAA